MCRGQTRLVSPKLANEPEGPTYPIPPPLSPNTAPSVQELLLMILARLEGVPPTPATVEVPVSTVPVGSSRALSKLVNDPCGSFFSFNGSF